MIGKVVRLELASVAERRPPAFGTGQALYIHFTVYSM